MARKAYHHGNLRDELIAAALRLVETKGVRNFSMREAAREAEVAASAPYRHFDDRAALMTAIAEEALAQLLTHTQEAIARAEPEPLAQYRAAGVAYVVFAATHPAQFIVLHDAEYASPEASTTLADYHAKSTAVIGAVLEQIQDQTHDSTLPMEAIEFTASTLMYGLARRFVDGHLTKEGYGPEEAERLAMLVTEVLGRGLLGMHTPDK